MVRWAFTQNSSRLVFIKQGSMKSFVSVAGFRSTKSISAWLVMSLLKNVEMCGLIIDWLLPKNFVWNVGGNQRSCNLRIRCRRLYRLLPIYVLRLFTTFYCKHHWVMPTHLLRCSKQRKGRLTYRQASLWLHKMTNPSYRWWYEGFLVVGSAVCGLARFCLNKLYPCSVQMSIERTILPCRRKTPHRRTRCGENECYS